MADRLIGIRTNDADVVDRLRIRLAPWVVDEEAAPNISLTVGGRTRGRRDAHRVHRRGVQTFRSFDLDEAVDAAIAHVHTMLPQPAGTLELYGRVLLRNGAAIVLGDAFAEGIDSHARRLIEQGYQLVPYSPVLADPATGEVLIREGDQPIGGEYRRVPITVVVGLAAPAVPEDPAVVTFSHLSALVAGRSRPTRAADLEGLLALQQRVPFVRHDDLDARSVLAVLRNW